MSGQVLITGGSGFVGRNVVALFPDAAAPTRAQLDLLNGAAVLRYCRALRPRVVIHLAARVGGIAANMAAPADFLLDNVQADANVCAAVRACRPAHFLAMTSTCMYPDSLPESVYPMTENAVEAGPPPPTNASFAAAKRTLVHATRALHAQDGIAFTCLASTNIYGPHDHFGAEGSHFLAAAVARLYAARVSGAPVAIFFGTGVARRQVVYVRDLARLIRYFVERGPANDLVNVAADGVLSVADLAHAVAKAAGYRGDIVFNGTGPDGQYRKDVSTARLYALAPWQDMQTPLRLALRDTVDWYHRHGR